MIPISSLVVFRTRIFGQITVIAAWRTLILTADAVTFGEWGNVIEWTLAIGLSVIKIELVVGRRSSTLYSDLKRDDPCLYDVIISPITNQSAHLNSSWNARQISGHISRNSNIYFFLLFSFIYLFSSLLLTILNIILGIPRIIQLNKNLTSE